MTRKALVLLPLFFLFQSCGFYKFNQASIPANMKTVSVQFFENNAPLVVSYLSQQFTDALKERIRSQSRLSLIRENADGNFEGRITGYAISPVAVGANEMANKSRVTITVSVKFTNLLDEKLSFEQSFSQFEEINGTTIQTGQEAAVIRNINAKLTEDIFNRAFANW